MREIGIIRNEVKDVDGEDTVIGFEVTSKCRGKVAVLVSEATAARLWKAQKEYRRAQRVLSKQYYAARQESVFARALETIPFEGDCTLVVTKDGESRTLHGVVKYRGYYWVSVECHPRKEERYYQLGSRPLYSPLDGEKFVLIKWRRGWFPKDWEKRWKR